MKYIELFEKKTKFKKEPLTYNDIMGRLLHIYGSIPVPKQKSSSVIKKILWDNFHKIGDRPSPFYKIGKDIDLEYQSDQDKVRFVDYFDSLLTNKEIRGHNFEGFIAAVYNGQLSEQMDSRYDVIIKDKTWSIKFVNGPMESPEIGSFKDSLSYNNLFNSEIDMFNLKKLVQSEGGLVQMFQKADRDIRKSVWEKVISKDITGGWMIAYPIKNNTQIVVSVINLLTMRKLLYSGLATVPKGGSENLFSLRISSKYKNFPGVKNFIINIPKLTLEELKKIYLSEDEENWSREIFGKYGSKIRPDVLRYIKSNPQEVAARLSRYNDFRN